MEKTIKCLIKITISFLLRNRSVSLRRYAGMFGVVFAVVLTASAAYELLGYPTPIDSQTMLANPWIAGLLSLAPTNGGGLRGGGGGAELALCLDAVSMNI
jgi:hypothetical protein